MTRIEMYAEEDGRSPVEEFIESCDLKMQAKIFQFVALLEDKGAALRPPYSKHIEEGIFELRIQQGGNTSRVLYFFVIGDIAVLTNGFIKKSQKTPRSEIALAKKRRNDYLERMGM